MIQANEFRIGNWISFNGVERYKVEGVTRDGVLVYSHAVRLKYFAIDLAQGIPLTEERLIKSGFTVNSIKEWKIYEYGFISLRRYQDGTFKVQWYFQTIKVNLKYLHQLQNLYFALTGEELNIEL